MAIGYHWLFFAEINKAALLFGALFVIAATIFSVEGIQHRVRARLGSSLAPALRTDFLLAITAIASGVPNFAFHYPD
jgi:hypothetical protein